MKKILIVNNNFHIGGVQKALISLLWEIKDKYDVTLLLLYNNGEYKNDVPDGVTVISAGGFYRYIGMTKNDVKTVGDKLGRLFFGAISRLFGRRYAVKFMSIGQKTLTGYDAAISYLHNSSDKAFYGGCNDFVLKHVDTKKKITFLHCDFIMCNANTIQNEAQYSKFDTVAACSQGCANTFIKGFPNLKEKVHVVNNCHRFDEILKAAHEAPVTMSEDKINIVTVSRMSSEKGVERGVSAIAKLGDLKNKIHYYIVGDGARMALVQQEIKQNKLEDTVTLCGLLKNPYGYIASADLLLIPSYSEAAPLVIGEAAFLGIPILSTETSSAKDMIEQTQYGWVCENSEDGIVESLKYLISASEKIDAAKKSLRNIDMNNNHAIEKFCECIE